MASLKKPVCCPKCKNTEVRKVITNWTAPNYEGWICSSCFPPEIYLVKVIFPDAFIVYRTKRNKDICRECGVKRGEKEFAKGKNLCVDCKSKLHEKYRGNNKDKIKKRLEQYWKKVGPEERYRRVKAAIERSPEAFLRHLSIHIRKSSKRRMIAKGKLNDVCLLVEIDYDYLLQLYRDQSGKCAILGIPMTWEFNNLKTISVDRIDSTKGYIPGNVQLVTQFINTAKRHHSNEEVRAILDEFLSWFLRESKG